MRRLITIFSFFIFGFISKTYSQQITIGNVDQGPYGKWSSIAVPVTIDDPQGKLPVTNVFKLYISDATGSFTNEREIGSYKGFFTTFINGIIPNDIPAGNYKLRVKTYGPDLISNVSNQIKVETSTGVEAAIDAPAAQILSTNPKTFGNCEEVPGSLFNFSNTSTAGATVTAVVKNEFNSSDVKNISFEGSPVNFVADITFYTITVKAVLNGVVGTKAYFLINTPTNTPFSVPSSSTVCLPVGILEYGVESSSATGIQFNFPGNTYQVDWGDGTIEQYTLNKIRYNESKVKHTYYKSSCGKTIKINNTTYYNVFGIIIQAKNPYCQSGGVPVSSQAKVVEQPENRFSIPPYACLNTALKVPNNSVTGENPSNTSPECANNNVVYYWYVDDVPVTPNGVSITWQLNYTFTTPGEHRIRLESKSSSRCQAAPVERKIWIQNSPKPDFKLSGTIFCTSSEIQATDISVVDTANAAPNTYEWTITGPSAAVYLNGTSKLSKNPQFKFSAPGIYTAKLTITSSCQPVSSTERQFVVNEKPTISVNWQTNLCGKGQLLTFNNTSGNPVPTKITGTSKEGTGKYTWKITGGAFTFRNGTSENSQEPSILFSDYGTYLIVVTAENNCGVAVESREITFNESPTVSAGEDITACAGNPVSLSASLSGPPVSAFQWVGGKGTFSPGRNVLNPVYTPSTEEIAAGKVELTLSATTMNPAPCDKVQDVVVITINPVNKITSEKEKSICTGSAVNYKPVALIGNSNISWTAVGSANASGFSPAGTGDINDVITNTSSDVVATVTYTIVPEANGCQGEPFTYTVTVYPTPGVQTKVPSRVVCTGLPAVINLVGSFPNILYTWTSTVTGNITGNTNQRTPVAVTAIKDILLNADNTEGTVTYTITPVTSNGCTGSPVVVTLSVTAAPVKAQAGADAKVCNVPSIKLSGNNPGKGAGKWTLTSGQTGITFDDVTAPEATASGLKAGQTYKFKWTITGPGTCTSSEDEVVVINLSEIAGNTITYSGYTVCEGSSVNIAGSTVTGGDGTYTYKWETSKDGNTWTVLNTAATSKNLTVAVTETTYFRRTAFSGDCNVASNTVKVDVQKGIFNNTIKGDQFVCPGVVPATLTGNIPEGGDGVYKYQWEQSTDGINWSVIISATEPSLTLPVLKQTTSYRRIVSSTICVGEQQSPSNTVQVKVSKGAIANFTWRSETACAPFNISSSNITADLSEDGDTYEWFVNGVSLGKGRTFPGYTLKNPGDQAEVRLEVTSALGCGMNRFSHTFKTNQGITAKIAADKLQGCGPVLVKFTNKTDNTEGLSFEWNFGNGQRSFDQNPASISFDARPDGKDTVYVVSLKAVSACAVSSDTVKIRVIGKPNPKFSPSTVTGCSPLKVTFRNLSPGSSNTYIWNYGDGKTDTTYNSAAVEHIFTTGKSKTFTVTLTVKNDCGEKTLPVNISVAPNTVNPDLVISADQLAGCAPHTVKFYNNTTGAVSYTYDFGDGSDPLTTNSDEPIEHTFTKGGDYFVKLTASNCSDTTIVRKITVYKQADAKFIADVTEGCAPLTVKITNQTTNAIAQWWDFGDGTPLVNAVNPAPHVFTAKQASYTIKLITKSAYGCMDTLVMKDYIKVTAPAVAAFKVEPGLTIQYPNYQFEFRNTSKGEYSKVVWDFGDDSPLNTSADPQHTYPDTGTYKVKLIVSNSLGCSDVVEQTVRIAGVPGALFIPNAFMPNSATEELRSFRPKGSGLEKWHMRVFNKWGEQIWETDKLDDKGAPLEFWDGTIHGTPAPQGIYFWEVSAVFKNGTEWAGMPYKNSEPKKTGDLHLIR